VNVHDLDCIFKPTRIAVVGACEHPGGAGCKVLANLVEYGFGGVIYPISTAREAVRGIPTHASLEEVPRTPDLVVVASPPAEVPEVVDRCGKVGARGVIVVSAGFREAGQAGRAYEARLSAVAARHPHLRILGPNSLGVIVPHLGINVSAAVTAPKPGRLAFLSQSAALSNAVLDWAVEEGIGFSCFVSLGNALDVGFGDVVDYLGEDPATRAIILYLQSLEHARGFMSAARAFARTKPIVAYKAGRFAESARVAASHTGAMVAEDAVYQAAFERAGIVRVTELDDVFDVAELLGGQRLPEASRLAIATNAGGPGVIAADALLNRGGSLATLSDDTCTALGAVLPAEWPGGNPVDLQDAAPAERFAEVSRVLLGDPGVDGLLVILSPQSDNDPTDTALRIVEVARRSHKPVLAAWMGGARVREAIRILNEAGLPTHRTPEQAVRAFMHLVTYANNLKALYETPRNVPLNFTLNRTRLRRRADRLIADNAPHDLDERQAKALLKAYRIPVIATHSARDADQAVRAARRLGYPVAIKVLSPDISHKLDVGGVMLNVYGDLAVSAAFDKVLANARQGAPQARLRGVTVQRMHGPDNAVELILGAKKDPTFGSVIMVGMGGVAAGVMQDRALGLPPLNERLALHMLQSLRAWPLLEGYRGLPGVELERLVETIIRFSYLVADYPEIRELDINPLLATPEEVVALDAAAVLDVGARRSVALPYAHLAIEPYPEDCVRRVTLKGGTPVTLRPIKPEDEPLWHELHARSSPESLRSRFRSLFKATTHEMATRYCYIDYSRDMTLVAEVSQGGRPLLVGVGGFSADADRRTAEYAVIVLDAWQGKGLGTALLDYTEEIARRWGIERLFAETDRDNRAMQRIFKARGFVLRVEDDVVYAEKSLAEEERTEPVVQGVVAG
jgi:acetyltransferase